MSYTLIVSPLVQAATATMRPVALERLQRELVEVGLRLGQEPVARLGAVDIEVVVHHERA
jgi:hypothetical protein